LRYLSLSNGKNDLLHRRPLHSSIRIAQLRWAAALILAAAIGCRASPWPDFGPGDRVPMRMVPTTSLPESPAGTPDTVRAVNFESPQMAAPPLASDFDNLSPWPMSLDETIEIALSNNPVIQNSGGRVLASSNTVRSTLDPAIATSDPNFGPEAALSAFDIQFESSLAWNGGGRPVGSGFAYGPFGVYAQPTTMATLGFAKTIPTGTRFQVGGVGGYDSKLATGGYAAVGAEVRHPLLRGAGSEFNYIAGPYGRPGTYRGLWIAQIDADRVQLELEEAVYGLVHEVASTYWELYFAFQNLDSKRATLEHARQVWEREKRRAAEHVSPADFEAAARQQFFSAKAGVENAISGTTDSSPGVYGVEVKLRTLLGIPATDGTLIRPATPPLEVDFRFDWNESLGVAECRRLEVRRQNAELQKCDLELRAATNLTRPEVDLVGQFRRLAGDPGDDNPLFADALQGWQLGIEVNKALGNRREKTAERNARLRLGRAHAVLDTQRKQIAGQLRLAFTELDRAYQVTQSLAAGREAAQQRLRAETERHAAGETPVERVLEAQTRAAVADTAYLRSLLDYNLAFIQLHAARGTLLDVFGVGLSPSGSDEETSFAHQAPSAFAAGAGRTPHAVR